ncbi:bifunctional diaminohydroxyphosphoribosylaminopyrimidine deaminase/5-amino-6-(5-phosphoribosylamino)uracil reductase RibD [Ketobacter alkanivorans]|uniref:Riboflavin biosynthesis protein RibD n=1 Tax=Ketobacter alkanivorans TaxID=1917421 RepID=A0A2K9LMT5_9GAMM|nr:bifunctional diaminohydroxyphosphoribosylaminopyrimidine deaminase/5-amino-6-(5-phosphoribosylamino)uracil reductase RibD [Ketobacter alkanivorans]AUM13676.1 riboflavin biosynthesis protein RibD [Ketobacter alkanivorans]
MTAALFTKADHQHMAEAIRLAWRGLYTTHPNPRVGCVLVKEGQIVGRGWHQIAGEGHAEVNALRQAGPAAQGATAYVSLEPCSHHGKTPPCAEALIQAGVAKVISAMEDPNPRVSGRGHQLLESAGIQTACGLMQAQAEQINPGFNKRMRTGLPWVVVKSAMSVDGRTAMANGESQWITDPAARADVQRLRARVEAIITGVDTVIADDPSLTVRPDMWPQAVAGDEPSAGWSWPHGRQPIQPLRVIVDSTLRTPRDAKILQQPGKTLIAHTSGDIEKVAVLAAAGAELTQLPAVNGKVDLNALLLELARREVNEVLVEAGAVLAGAFVQQQLVDQWVCYLAPKLMGSSARPVLDFDLRTMSQAQALHLTDLRQIGQDIRMTYGWSR